MTEHETASPSKALKITCIGGGPAGLLFAILAATGGHTVTVVERQEPEESFGWGVVFWNDLLSQLDVADPRFAETLRSRAYVWHDQIVQVGDQQPVRIPSTGFSMRRRLILELLRARAAEVGVRIEARSFDDDPAALSPAGSDPAGSDPAGSDAALAGTDLVVAADGVNSRLRRSLTGLGTQLTHRRNKYIWLGTDREFDSFTFPFVRTEAGWLWAHAYGFDAGASTFVVETTPETWGRLGFATMGPDATMRRLEEIFAASLDGHRLAPQAGTRDRSPWNEFVVVRNERWHATAGATPVALMGDAAHTTHFTIGSGTRLAMEDAMALARALVTEPSLEAALTAYETRRIGELEVVQRAATRSAIWFEQVARYADRPASDVARMMDDRRSPVMPLLPVGLYLALTHTADRLPGVAGPLRRMVSKVMA